MTLYTLIDTLKRLALCLPNVRSTSEGDIYRTLNNNPSTQYDVVHIMQNTHQHLEYLDRYNLTIFFVSRLDDTLEDNRLQCQSLGKEVLKTLIKDFCDMYDLDFPTYTVQVFTEKFVDLCAGCYVNLTFEIPADACADDYSEVVSIYQSKTVDITENGEYTILPDSGFTALSDVTVNVQVRCSGGCTPEELEEMYESGYTEGYNDGLADCGSDYDEGYRDGFQSGYTSGMTDGEQYWFPSGYTSGVNYQKGKLSATTFTENGTYTRSNGWSAVTVDIDTQPYYNSGYTSGMTDGYTSGITYQKSLMITTAFTQNGEYSRDNGWSGVTVNVPTRYDEGFNDGYEQGTIDGIEYQKGLISELIVIENGTYIAENGYSPVIVNVPTGYTQDDLDEAYNQGYEDGYNNRPRLTVSPTEINATSQSGTTTIQLSSNTTWVVSYVPSWCSISPMSGNGDTNLALTITNNTGESRTSAVTFSTTDNYATASTVVNQAEIEGSISVVPSSNNLHYNAQTLTLTVTSNVGWTITDYPEWAVPNILSGNSGNTTVIVTLPENTGNERRGYIYFETVYGNAETSVYIRQGYNNVPIGYEGQYLTFEIISGGTFGKLHLYGDGQVLQYSVNNGAWNNISASTTNNNYTTDYTNYETVQGTLIGTFTTGDKIRFKGTRNNYEGVRFTTTEGVKLKAYGNIMSLIGGDNFVNLKTLSSSYAFKGVLSQNSYLVSAENLILAATGLTTYCYADLFDGCTSLTVAPALPATNLSGANNCYYEMFQGCTSLKTAPALPATTLSNYCYSSMFYQCTNLVNAPNLPATTLKEGCYQLMFGQCTKLITLPTLSATTLAKDCYNSMFASSGVKTIPNNYLPITTLTEGCYYNMFACCSNLTSVPEQLLPATTLYKNCYAQMFDRCYALEKAPFLNAPILVNGCYTKMFYCCYKLKYIKCLATQNISGTNTTNWVYRAGSNVYFDTKIFVKATSASSWTTGDNGIPSNWTIQNAN